MICLIWEFLGKSWVPMHDFMLWVCKKTDKEVISCPGNKRGLCVQGKVVRVNGGLLGRDSDVVSSQGSRMTLTGEAESFLWLTTPVKANQQPQGLGCPGRKDSISPSCHREIQKTTTSESEWSRVYYNYGIGAIIATIYSACWVYYSKCFPCINSFNPHFMAKK